ncbi:MAG: TIM barrel protein, partial [Clostridia bacterium]|nr:TIM barrel protein [Clostridia bacterium]
DKERLCEIVRLQEENGIYCSSYGTYFRLGVNDISELSEYINAAKILGTNILRLWCGNKNCNEYSDEEKEYLFGQAKIAAELAEKRNVYMCMECHNNSYTETLEGALELMKAVDSGHFGMYWQPNQNLSFEKNVQYAKEISKYVKCVHVFYWKDREKHPLHEAVQMWKEYLVCFESQTNFLLEFMPEDRLESLKNESAALFEILGE